MSDTDIDKELRKRSLAALREYVEARSKNSQHLWPQTNNDADDGYSNIKYISRLLKKNKK